MSSSNTPPGNEGPDPGSTDPLSAESTLERINSVLHAVGEKGGGFGDAFFPDFVERLARSLEIRIAFVAECMQQNRVRVKAIWNKERLDVPFEYDLTDTPCERVIQGELCHYRDDVTRLFPKDKGLKEWGGRGYVGVPLRDGEGVVIGHMVLLDDQPIDNAAWMQSLLQALAARAAAELERGQADRLRREAIAELEAAKKRVEAENTYLRHEVARQGGFEEIIGTSPPIRRMLETIGQAAPTDTTVLITGETGTGKELVARAIHAASKRANKALVSINCVLRPVDYDIAYGVYGDMTQHGWERDDWPQLAEKVLAADILVLCASIWLGEKTSVCTKVIERLYGDSHVLNDVGQYAYYGRVGGCLITGNEDGGKHCSMNILYSLQHPGYVIPPQADSDWLGEAGPENDFTNRNTTFMTWNLMHLARMLKSAGGIPAHGNQRSEWDAGCRFDYPNPEYR